MCAVTPVGRNQLDPHSNAIPLYTSYIKDTTDVPDAISAECRGRRFDKHFAGAGLLRDAVVHLKREAYNTSAFLP